MVSYDFPISLPTDPTPSRILPRPSARVAVSRSPFTSQRDKQVYDGQILVWEVELPPIVEEATYSQWEATFYKLNGREGTCLFGDPTRTSPRGSYDSGLDTPLVHNGLSPTPNQEGDRVLATDGWRVSESGLLLEGDWIQLGSSGTVSLHKVLSDVDSDGSGVAEIDIWPRLRRTLNDNEALTLENTVGRWELADNEFDYTIEGALWGFSFTLVEVIS